MATINYMWINPLIVQGSNVFVFLVRTDMTGQLRIYHLGFWCHCLRFSFCGSHLGSYNNYPLHFSFTDTVLMHNSSPLSTLPIK